MKTWTTITEAAADGSDDLVITFPPEMLAEVGWQEGDTIEWLDNGDGSWTLQKKQILSE